MTRGDGALLRFGAPLMMDVRRLANPSGVEDRLLAPTGCVNGVSDSDCQHKHRTAADAAILSHAHDD